MRLTLRTLLAYLDDILEPADAQELGRRIEDSEFASSLVHRVRSSTRLMRLGAPKLTGKGMGLDANTVAEYLDNTLPQERVPDFEKVCLESDVHLAEVASCHQVLTLVLGEPAEIPDPMRDRVYELTVTSDSTAPSELDAGPQRGNGQVAEATGDHSASVPPPPPEESGPPPVKSEKIDEFVVPAERSRLRPIAVTAGVVATFCVVAFFAMGLDDGNPIIAAFSNSRSEQPGDETRPGPVEPLPSRNDNDVSPATGEPLDQTPSGAGGEAARESGDNSAAIDQGSGEEPRPPADGQAPPIEIPEKPGPAGNDEAVAAGGDRDPQGDAAADQNASPTPTEPPVEGPPETRVARGDDVTTPNPIPTPPAPADAGAGVAVPVADPAAGRLTSETEVLSRRDDKSAGWVRVKPLDPVNVGDRLLALPTYRPQILLTAGVQLVVVGPASLDIESSDEPDIARLSVGFGRLLAFSHGKSGDALDLNLAGRGGRLTLVDAGAVLALEIRRYLPPGADAESTQALVIVELTARNGRLAWLDAATGQNIAIEPDVTCRMLDDKPAQMIAASDLVWIDPQSVSFIDRSASRKLEPELAVGRPLALSLQEQLADRRLEVRSLALRCLGYMNHFDAFLEALNDRNYRSYWRGHVDALRDALARGPETAQAVRLTFERLRGDASAELNRLLRGYNPQQLEATGAAELVRLLEHDAMDVRVLAYENLRRITEKTQLFQPEKDPRQQRRAILDWQRNLTEGQIEYKHAPGPFAHERAEAAGD